MDTFHVAVILVLVGAVWTCSPEGYREVYMDEMAHYSSIVAYGLVTEKFPDELQSSSFSVEFEVKCSYKGGALPSKINISHAGYMDGMCGYKNFTVGTEYIVFLSHYGTRYEQIYDKTMEAGASMAELLSFCGLQMDYPSDGNTGQCQDVQKDSCKEYKSHRIVHPPPPPVNKEGLIPPLFDDADGSGDLTSTVMEMETTESKMEITSSASEMGMTSPKTEMTSTVKENPKTISVVTPSSETPTERKKSTEVVIVPIVTPEARDDSENRRPEYGAVNDDSGNSGNRITATATLIVLMLFWTLN